MVWTIHGFNGLSDVRHTIYSFGENWSTSLATVGQFFYIGPLLNVLFWVIIVSTLAYFTTRMVASARFNRGSRRNLAIVESMGVGAQAFVHIARVGEKYVLIGVTRGQVSMLTELDPSQLQLPEGGVIPPTFEALMKRLRPPGNGSERDQ